MMIHDALWVEALKKEERQVENLMREITTNTGKLSVPLEIDCE